MWGLFRTLGFVLLLGTAAHADIGLMLGESTGQGMSRWTSAGHSAVYLSRVCPETPVRLRLCAPGEQGSVVSNYITFNEDKPYEWNVVPLSIFLYGVENPKDRPVVATPEVRAALQEHFREKYLGDLCPEGPCTDSKAHWRDLVAANFARDIYMFEASTTLEQDRVFIEKFNALPNVDHYNGFTRNCADFARLVVNTYFPGAARADHLNDFWMTSPKAIAKSFTHYAVKHPELDFQVVRYTQIPGSYRRSSDARKGTEVAFTSKKWFFPMLLRSNELVMFASSYLLTGRFNPERELRRRPTQQVTAELIEAREARAQGDRTFAHELKHSVKQQREAVFGTQDDWNRYSDALLEFREEANTRELLPTSHTLKEVLNELASHTRCEIDDRGSVWLRHEDAGELRKVGISASNINSPESDGELSYKLLLVRTSAELSNVSKNREMLPEFEANWQLLEDSRHNLDWKILARQRRNGEPTTSEDADVGEHRTMPSGSALLP